MTTGDLYEVLSLRSLRRAWFRVEDSDGCAGIDGVTLSRFARDLDEQLARLLNEIRSSLYRPLPLLRFCIPKKDGTERPLNVAAVRDRIAQRAVIDLIEPDLEAEFESCSYGFRKGRSVRLALEQIEFLRDAGYTWVVEADIDDFFDMVDHSILMSKIEAFVKDRHLQKLISLWVRARIYDGKRLWTVGRGLPQGQPISPILANLYLDEFDEIINQGGRKLVRYADDFVILCKSKPKAESALRLTRRMIRELGLALNDEDTGVTHFNQGFSYLGAKFFLSMCVVPPRKRRERTGAVTMPERLFSALPNMENYQFNPVLGQRLARALSLDTSEDKMGTDVNSLQSNSDFMPPATVTLCTLYVHEHGATVRYENERIEVVSYGRELISIPIRKIEQIILYGNSQITTTVMKKCLQQRIPIFIFSGPSRLLGSIETHGDGNLELQRMQFERTNDEAFRFSVARRIVAGKLSNCRRYLQDRSHETKVPTLNDPIRRMAEILDSLTHAEAIDEVLGCEGAGAAAYFDGLAECIPSPFTFVKRTRRPPLDPVNALLSFGYTMLFQNIYALVRARGLFAHLGFLHTAQQGHPALCSDLIEEFRPVIVDSLIIGCLNRKIFSLDDFYYEQTVFEDVTPEDIPEFTGISPDQQTRACILKDEARRSFIREFERRMNTSVTHRQAGIKTSWRGCIDLQIGHLIKVIRGEASGYQPVEFK